MGTLFESDTLEATLIPDGGEVIGSSHRFGE
jgi:hypothetical protein